MKKNTVVILITTIILVIAVILIFISEWSIERKNNKEIAKTVDSLEVQEENKEEDKEDKTKEDNSEKNVEQENNDDANTDKQSNNDKNTKNDNNMTNNVSNDTNKDVEKDVEDNTNNNINKDVDEYINVPAERPDFAYDRVNVRITLERTNMNKEYTVEEFSEVELVSIENQNLEYLEGDSLTLYLKNPGKENVLNAVELLKKNPIVKYAEVEGMTYAE